MAGAFGAGRSPIGLGILSGRDEPLDEGFLRARVETAVARRRALFPGADAFRAVHGEADLLPGYFADRYGDLLAVQHLAEWAEARREQLARMAAQACGARAVGARDDGSSRAFGMRPRRPPA